MRETLYPGLVGATFSFVVGALTVEILVFGVPADRLIPVSQMIVQFDSFLTGGAAVAFSFFWGSLVREFRALRTQMNDWKVRLKGFPNESADVEFLLKKAQLSEGFLLAGIGGIINFALSALLAVGAAITGNDWYLVFSLLTLAFGVGTMFWSWFEFHKASEIVSDLVESGRAALARLDKEDSSSSRAPN